MKKSRYQWEQFSKKRVLDSFYELYVFGRIKSYTKIKGAMFRITISGVQLIIYGLGWQKRVVVVIFYQLDHSVQLNGVKDAAFPFSREMLRFCNVRRTI